jgi:hypothetical protein
VVAGGHLDDDLVARWAYAIRQSAGPVPIAVYRRGGERGRMRQANNAVLPNNPLDAQRKLLAVLSPEVATRPAAGARRMSPPPRAARL